MSILYWGEGFENFRVALDAALGSDAEGVSLCWKANGDELRQALATEGDRIRLVVLAPPSAKALQDLRFLLSGVPIIVLLPSGAPEAVQAAHALLPRFVASAGDGLADAAAVAANILRGGKNGARAVNERG